MHGVHSQPGLCQQVCLLLEVGKCFFLTAVLKVNVAIYGTRQNECNKHTAAAHGGMCAAFLPPKAPHFDGRAAVCRLVKLPDCGTFCRENVACSPNCGVWQKSSQFRIPQLPAQTINVWRGFLIKKQCTNFTNCCILFDAYVKEQNTKHIRT